MVTDTKKLENRKLKEEAMAKIKRVTLKNVGEFIYRASDKALGKSGIAIRPGEVYELSEEKALQMTRDFPENWNLVDVEDPKENQGLVEKLATNIAAGQVKKNTTKNIERATAAMKDKDISNTPFARFTKRLKLNTVQTATIKNKDELFKVITAADYIGLNSYAFLTKPLKNEIGANQKLNIRYCVDGKILGDIKLTQTKKENVKKEESEEETDIDVDNIVIKKSKDYDVDEIPSVDDIEDPDDEKDDEDLDDLDIDLDDEEEKPKKEKSKDKKKRKAKKLK